MRRLGTFIRGLRNHSDRRRSTRSRNSRDYRSQPLEDRCLLTSLVTHYDADAIAAVPDGTVVSQLPDQSGYSNTAQQAPGGLPATYVNSGIGGKPSLQFVPGTGYASVTTMGSYGIQADAAWSMVVVARVDANQAQVVALGNGQQVNGLSLIEIEQTGSGPRLDIAGGWSHDVVLSPNGSFSPFVSQDVIFTITH
ncbi:MAG: hypothetical protein KDA96_15265, partial [Planctomycetaceae bacterium]|nr:hypothetical protein [Planctomycetaceae bacterium]